MVRRDIYLSPWYKFRSCDCFETHIRDMPYPGRRSGPSVPPAEMFPRRPLVDAAVLRHRRLFQFNLPLRCTQRADCAPLVQVNQPKPVYGPTIDSTPEDAVWAQCHRFLVEHQFYRLIAEVVEDTSVSPTIKAHFGGRAELNAKRGQQLPAQFVSQRLRNLRETQLLRSQQPGSLAVSPRNCPHVQYQNATGADLVRGEQRNAIGPGGCRNQYRPQERREAK